MTINSSQNEIDTQDISLAAYLMTHFRHYCENCGTSETPQWRKGWYSDVLNRNVLLCNACGLKYHKNQYCPYCRFIYGKDDKCSSVWSTCHCCGRHVHIVCERRFGKLDFGSSNYECPNCRKETIQPNWTRHALLDSEMDLLNLADASTTRAAAACNMETD